MKLMKSLLLGSAAGLAAAAGAQAADLPVTKAAPVEYVRVCSAYGAGFFYIPGTDTCLRIAGRARFEYNIERQRTRNADPTGFRSLGRLQLDARTQTAYGTLRAFVRLEIARRNGEFFSGTAQRRGEAELATGFDFFGRAQHQIYLDKAFVQFAGITAGRATSFFDFYSNDLNWFGITGSDRGATNLLAYTASFGSGFSATLSIEDPQERRYPIVTNLGGNSLVAGGNLFSVAAPTVLLVDPVTGLPIPSAVVGQNQRDLMPDIVGALRVDQSWGSAQLSGAVHQISVVSAPIPGAPSPLNPFAGANFTGFAPSTEYGFAVQGGVKINLPMIAPGDLLYLQAAYARGGLDYTISGNWVFGGATGSQFGFGGALGKFAVTTADGIINPLSAQVKLSNSFAAIAGFLHYWTPQWRSGFTAGYTRIDYPNLGGFFAQTAAVQAATFGPTGTLGTTGVVRDFSLINLATNLIWSPVRDLDIGVELAYDRIKLHGAPVADLNKCGGVAVFVAGTVSAAATPCPFTAKSEDVYRARLRIQRDF